MYQSKAQVNSVMVKTKIMSYASQKDIMHRLIGKKGLTNQRQVYIFLRRPFIIF